MFLKAFFLAVVKTQNGMVKSLVMLKIEPYSGKMEPSNCSILYIIMNQYILFCLILSQITNLDSSKLKESADDSFKLVKNGRKFSKKGRKHCGERRNCSLRAISPFPTGFSKDLYCRHVKTRACLGKR